MTSFRNKRFTMKTKKILYWVTTIWLSVAMLTSAIFALIKPEEVIELYHTLGYPTYLINFISLAKILGVITLLLNPYKKLVEWAYAGFFFDFLLAFLAHYQINDGEQWWVLIPFALLLVSHQLKDISRH